MEGKVSEERAKAKALQEKEKQDRLGKDSDAASVIEDQQLSPTPSYSSSEGGTVDKTSPVKEGTGIPRACVSKLYKLTSIMFL